MTKKTKPTPCPVQPQGTPELLAQSFRSNLREAPRLLFDYYTATFHDYTNNRIHALTTHLLQHFPTYDIRPLPRSSFGYLNSFQIIDLSNDNRQVALGLYGGSVNVGKFTLQCSGYTSHALALYLREHFPAHSVSRCDIALDFEGSGAWEYFYNLATVYGMARPSVSLRQVGDYHKAQKGRTLYIGNPQTSPCYARFYEKGKQDPANYAADSVRCEFCVRPRTAKAKRLAATLPILELLSYSTFSRYFIDTLDLSNLPVAKPKQLKREPSAFEKSLKGLTSQYAATLRELYARCYENPTAFAALLLDLEAHEIPPPLCSVPDASADTQPLPKS